MSIPETSLEYLRTAARAADDKKAENIVAIDVSEALAIVDSFLIASAPNERQVASIVDAIEEELQDKHDLKPLRREGRAEGRWVLLDFGDVVVHVQHDEERAFYALERLWGDAPRSIWGWPRPRRSRRQADPAGERRPICAAAERPLLFNALPNGRRTQRKRAGTLDEGFSPRTW